MATEDTDHYVGGACRLTLTFANANDVLTDPSTVALKVRKPSGTVTTYAIGDLTDQAGLGVYTLDVPNTEAGKWLAKAVSTGVIAAQPHRWIVNSTPLD